MLRDRRAYYVSTAEDKGENTLFFMNHANRWFHLVDFDKIFRDHKQYCPIEDVQLQWTYPANPPLHVTLATYRKINNDFKFDDWKNEFYEHVFSDDFVCPCTTFIPELVNRSNTVNNKHVVTGTYADVFPDQGLGDRILMGSNFREQQDTFLSTAASSIKEAVCEFVKRFPQHSNRLTEWGRILSSAFANEAQWHIDNTPKRVVENVLNPIHTSLDRNIFTQCSQVFNFLRADKASSNLILTCNNWYKYHAVKFLSNTQDYTRVVDKTTEQIIHEMAAATYRHLHIPNKDRHIGPLKLPYFYPMPKMHKSPVAARPVTAAHDCVFTPAQRVSCPWTSSDTGM